MSNITTRGAPTRFERRSDIQEFNTISRDSFPLPFIMLILVQNNIDKGILACGLCEIKNSGGQHTEVELWSGSRGFISGRELGTLS